MNKDVEEVGLDCSNKHLALAFAIVGTATTLWAISICALALWWVGALGA